MKETQKKNTSAFGTNKSGFTFIELIVVIAVIGILMSVAITQLRVPGQSPVQSFTNNLYTVVKHTQLSALASHRTYRIVLGLENQEVYVEQATDAYDVSGKLQFEPVQGQWQSRIEIPQELVFEAVYVNGTDELAGGITQRIWIYCYPSGMLQQTQLVLRDTQTQEQYTVYINPVTADVQTV